MSQGRRRVQSWHLRQRTRRKHRQTRWGDPTPDTSVVTGSYPDLTYVHGKKTVGRELWGPAPQGWPTDPSGWSCGQSLRVSVLCFQLPLRPFPAWASAGGGARTGGLFALSKTWGLCLSEVNPTPPLHSRSPGLLMGVPGRGSGHTGVKWFTMLEPQWDFKGGGLPWPESSPPQGK